MPGSLFRLFAVAGLLLFGAPLALAAEANDPWPGLVQDIFNNRPMNDGSDVIGSRNARPCRGCRHRAGDLANEAVAR